MIDSSIDAPPPCAAANTFGAEVAIDVGGVGTGFAYAFLDAGTSLDVAVAIGTQVVILHGDNAGGFGNPTIVDTPAIGVATGDFNDDGPTDLLLWSDNAVVVRIQDPANRGTFLAPVAFPGSFANVKNVLVENFDGNFRPDAIVQDDNGRRVFTSNFNGSFSTSTVNIGAAGDDLLFTAQVDGQARFDVVLVDQAGNVKLSLGSSGVTLSQPVTIATGAVGHGVGVGIFTDGDNLKDLMITTAAGGKLFKQNTNGTFTEQPGVIPGIVGPSMSVVDINSDLTDDIVVQGSIVMQCPPTSGVFTQVESINATAPVLFEDFGTDFRPDLIRLEGTNLIVRNQ
ncbi:MAG TPA: VCBS repeat-containing protein [Kofleriaceae bacterium]|nr:VCBS repeat-containing protein [Kofleriaceae bacterium]